MTRADIALEGVINNLPITAANAEQGILIVLILIATLWLLLTPSKPRYIHPPYYNDYPPNNRWNRRPPYMW